MTDQNQILISQLKSRNLDERVMAIDILGEVGDQEALIKLRERMSHIHREYQALIISIGKLKRKLGVK